MATHNELGKAGEQLAVEYLISKDYIIRDTNWRCGKMELDIVAERGNRIIIVEVKTRSSDLQMPYDAVDSRKIRSLVRAANAYVNYFNLSHEVQFDIISIIGSHGDYAIEHIPDAFLPPLNTY